MRREAADANLLTVSVLRYYQLSSLALGAGYCLFFLYFEAYWNLLGPGVFLLCVLMSLSLPPDRERLAAILLAGALWAAPSWCILVSGGLTSPLIIWLAPPAFMAGVLISWRWALGIGVVSIFVLALMAFFPERLAAINEITDDTVRQLMLFLAIGSAILFLMFYGFSYDLVTSRAKRRIEDLARSLEQKVDERTRALADSERRFKDIAGSASDWFWEMGPDLRFSYLSERFQDITGLEPEELLGKTRREMGIVPGVDEDTWQAYLNSLDQRKPHKDLVHSRIRNGRKVWLSISGNPVFDADGTFKGYRGSGRDITAQKNAVEELRANQQRLQALYHQSPLGVIVEDYSRVKMRLDRLAEQGVTDLRAYFNKHGDELNEMIGDICLLDANATQMRMMETSSMEEFRLFELDANIEAHEHWRRFYLDEIISLTERGGPYSGEIWDTTNAGKPIFLNLTTNIIDSHADDWSEVITTHEDITERKQAEAQLIEAKQRAEDANTAKSEFLASMSHEIRIPMTAVLGFADVLLNQDLDKESREKITYIKNATLSLLTIINGILDLSKLEAGKMEIEMINFHFPSLIDDSMKIFIENNAAGDSPLEISTTIQPDVPEGILSDPTRIRQILVNLVGNAVKFTKEGGVTLDVGLDEQSDGRMLRFAVTDTGIGLTGESRDKLFSKFTQADASISRQFEGSGLGLAICRRLVELMGGDIGVESRFGEGSTFWFTLPFTPATADVDNLPHKDDARYINKRPLNILVAEDNQMNQKVIAALMEGHGHRITIAEDGAEAVNAVRADDYDLILMDVRMPNMSGLDATRMIRQLPGGKGTIPIIALTADAMDENIADCLESGMNEVVAKPIRQGLLLAAVNKVLGEDINVVVEGPATPPRGADTEPPGGETPDPDVQRLLAKMQSVADRHGGD